jgi:histone acetyltransferase (RNA polymerase elongator complex component)
MGSSTSLVVGFYGGRPPQPPLLDAPAGQPFQVRVRPDLLSRRIAEGLRDRGALAVELDLLTFDDPVLRRAGRRYSGRLVERMAEGLRAMGLGVGLVLAPGLPGSSHASSLRDAEVAAEWADTVRIHPVIVIDGSRLAARHRSGLYVPLVLGEAVQICRDMMDVLEGRGVKVVRVGVQAGPDGLGRALAGPRHSSLRELVEAKRVLDRLRGMLDGTMRGAQIEIRCAAADETRTRGPLNEHVRILRAEFGLEEVYVVPEPELRRGQWDIQRLSIAATEKESH